jgi:opacity protein-like surface antigen
MKLFLCVLGLLVFTSPALAEETIRKEGDTSINFSISRSQIAEYKYGFGGKYWASSDIAYSASFDISETTRKSNDAAGTSTTKADSSYYALSLAVEKHLQPSFKLSPYIGGEVKYARFADTYDNTYWTPYNNYHDESLGKQYGVALLVGAEYALNRNISLAGEYAFGYSYSKNRYSSTWGEQKTRTSGFDTSVSRLMLLLYF